MFQNSHFALAVHVLTALSIRDRMTSVELAASVNTHPTFVRTLLGRLKEAGLVDVKMGKGGGANRRELDNFRAGARNENDLHNCPQQLVPLDR